VYTLSGKLFGVFSAYPPKSCLSPEWFGKIHVIQRIFSYMPQNNFAGNPLNLYVNYTLINLSNQPTLVHRISTPNTPGDLNESNRIRKAKTPRLAAEYYPPQASRSIPFFDYALIGVVYLLFLGTAWSAYKHQMTIRL